MKTDDVCRIHEMKVWKLARPKSREPACMHAPLKETIKIKRLWRYRVSNLRLQNRLVKEIPVVASVSKGTASHRIRLGLCAHPHNGARCLRRDTWFAWKERGIDRRPHYLVGSMRT